MMGRPALIFAAGPVERARFERIVNHSDTEVNTETGFERVLVEVNELHRRSDGPGQVCRFRAAKSDRFQ